MSPEPERISAGQSAPEVIASDEEGRLITFIVDRVNKLKNKIERHYGVETRFFGILMDKNECVHPIVETKIPGNTHGTLIALAGVGLELTFPLDGDTVDWGNNEKEVSYERLTIEAAKEENIINSAGERNVIILHSEESASEDTDGGVVDFIGILNSATDTNEQLYNTGVLFQGLKKASGMPTNNS